MNATLDVYMRIFSSILQHKQHAKNTKKSPSLLDLCEVSPDKRPQVESVLTEFQQKAAELKRQLSQRINNKEDVLGKLHQIKVKETLVSPFNVNATPWMLPDIDSESNNHTPTFMLNITVTSGRQT